MEKGVRESFERVIQAKKNKDKSVEAGREYVESYFEFVHYVESLHNLIAGHIAQQEEKGRIH